MMVVRQCRIFHDEAPRPCHCHAIACHAGRINAVKHIDSAFHAFNQMIRRSHTHKVPRLVFRQKRRGIFQHLIHEIRRLPYRQTTNSISGKVHGYELFRMPFAQILVHSPLHNAKQSLIGSSHRLLATLRPTQRPLCRGLGIFIVSRIWHTFVKRHDNIGPETHLHLHGYFRRKKFL